MLTGATATRITFVPGLNPLRADGVEFVQGGKKYKVAVSKEVILSAGKTHTPDPSQVCKTFSVFDRGVPDPPVA